MLSVKEAVSLLVSHVSMGVGMGDQRPKDAMEQSDCA